MSKSTSQEKAAEIPTGVSVTLTKPHTHKGVDHPTGATIRVDAATAKWLADNGVIEQEKN